MNKAENNDNAGVGDECDTVKKILTALFGDDYIKEVNINSIGLFEDWVRQTKRPASPPDGLQACSGCGTLRGTYEGSCCPDMRFVQVQELINDLWSKAYPMKFPVSAPDGFVLVPVEPTRHMMFAGFDKIPYDDRELYDIGECYKAMIAAAKGESNG